MQNPADLIILSIPAVSVAVGAYTTGTAIASPGIGKRLRIWGYSVGPLDIMDAVGKWRACLLPNSGAYAIGEIAGAGVSFGECHFPGGHALPAAQICRYLIQADAIGIDFEFSIYYTIESTA